MPDIQTTRLYINEVTLHDAAFIFELMNSKGWIKYIGDRAIHDLNAAQQYIKSNYLEVYKQKGFGFYKVQLLESKKMIGICGFAKRETLTFPDLGFAFFDEYAGLGYAFESSNALLSYARESLSFEKVGAITLSNNLKSIKLLEKLAFEFLEVIDYEGEKLQYYEITL